MQPASDRPSLWDDRPIADDRITAVPPLTSDARQPLDVEQRARLVALQLGAPGEGAAEPGVQQLSGHGIARPRRLGCDGELVIGPLQVGAILGQ